jgi:hypothetical protein
MPGKRGRTNGEGSIYQRASDEKRVGTLTLANGRRKVLYGDTADEVRSALTRAVRDRDAGGLGAAGERRSSLSVSPGPRCSRRAPGSAAIHRACSPSRRGGDSPVVLRHQRLVGLDHQRRGDHKIRRGPIAGDGDVPHHCDAQQRPHIGVVRLHLERIPEEDQQIELTLSDHRPDLLVAAEWPALQFVDAHPQLTLEERPGGPGGIQVMLSQERTVVSRPFQEILLLVVVRDQGDPFLLLHVARFPSDVIAPILGTAPRHRARKSPPDQYSLARRAPLSCGRRHSSR